MTGWLVVAGIVLVLAYCTLVLLIEMFGEWAINREAERTAAATFEADFVAHPADVAEQDTPAIIAEIEATLDEVIAYIKAAK